MFMAEEMYLIMYTQLFTYHKIVKMLPAPLVQLCNHLQEEYECDVLPYAQTISIFKWLSFQWCVAK